MFNQGQSTGWNSFFFTQFFFYHPNEVLTVTKTKGQSPVFECKTQMFSTCSRQDKNSTQHNEAYQFYVKSVTGQLQLKSETQPQNAVLKQIHSQLLFVFDCICVFKFT